MGQHLSEEGASEVVGVILLLGLTVLAVAIVAVSFLSAPQPDEMPHAAIAAGNTSGRLTLAHEGGDPLRAGEYLIYVDTGNGLVEKTADFSEPENGIWSIGESIDYTGTGAPRRGVVTVISGGSETILSEPAFVRGGAKFSPDPVEPDEGDGDIETPSNHVETIFVYATTFKFSGNTINGPGATTIITGGLNTKDLNDNASISVSNIYINGSGNLDSGSASLGSKEKPGVIYVNGDLTLLQGERHIYGDVYVNGNFRLSGAKIHGNVYVNGNLNLEWGIPSIDEGVYIYYTGTNTTPDYYDTGVIAKCIHQTTVPKLDMPDFEFPSLKSAEWYATNGYTSTLTNTKKVYAPSYTASGSASNIIVVAYNGDISIGEGWGTVTGVFFAPKGKVIFKGGSFEGLVIARDGFDVTSGGITATFKPISYYISNPDDYPF